MATNEGRSERLAALADEHAECEADCNAAWLLAEIDGLEQVVRQVADSGDPAAAENWLTDQTMQAGQ